LKASKPTLPGNLSRTSNVTGGCVSPSSALEIISEASRHLPDELLNHAPDIPWKKIRGIGNVLRHDYHKIADDVIWVVVVENIGPLKTATNLIRQHVGDAA
jgi:uncharacterized protein with HEPN domain